jgi:hypothetical protein
MEYKYISLTLLKLVSKILCYLFIVVTVPDITNLKARITDAFATITEDM